MIHLINHDSAPLHAPLMHAMHRDRKRVFVDLLRWDLSHDGEIERDQFDDEHAEYLVLQDRTTGDHLASMRLLDTRRPHLMSTVFPYLCENGVPCGADVREITRFCVSPRGCAAERRLARNMIVRAMVEYGLMMGVRTYTAACNMGFLSEVLSAGWRCRPLGLPVSEGGALIGALRIDIDPSTIRSLTMNWSCEPVELRLTETLLTLAA